MRSQDNDVIPNILRASNDVRESSFVSFNPNVPEEGRDNIDKHYIPRRNVWDIKAKTNERVYTIRDNKRVMKIPFENIPNLRAGLARYEYVIH